MHIADGVLSPPVWSGGLAVSGCIAAVVGARLPPSQIPRMALCTSFFFVASLVHIPVGPTSVHLVLSGLVGIIAGWWAFLPVLVGIILQTLLFQHGGITTIGVNSLTMGLPAYFALGIFSLGRRFRFRGRSFLFGLLAGAGSVFMGAVLLGGFLVFADRAFLPVARAAVVAHVPILSIEGVVTGFVTSFLTKVEPAVLEVQHG